MANNMTIGPVIPLGGNEIQMTTKGKVQVTNPEGKIITLSQDQFQKQTLKNADKLMNGEDIEYKKDNKALKVAGAVVGTAAVVTGVIYRKEIGKFFSKAVKKVKNFFKKDKPNTRTIFDSESGSTQTRKLKEKCIAEMTHQDLAAFDELLAKNKAEHKQRYNDIRAAFKNQK